MNIEAQKIDLVASAWEWQCPACGEYMVVVLAALEVECWGCGERFQVGRVHINMTREVADDA